MATFSTQDIFSVEGKVIVVTGGGTGIGKAITAGYVQNGAKVYITGRRKEVLEATAKEISSSAAKGGAVEVIQGDVATKAGVEKIIEAISAKESKIDVLVNCAGVMRAWTTTITDHNDPDSVEKLLWEGADDDAFNYSNSINVNGVYFMTAAAVPLLRKSDLPSVICIASIAGLANQRAMGSVSYGVSKAASMYLGASLLIPKLSIWAPYSLDVSIRFAARLKIRVNTICPGIFPSEMTAKSGENGYDMAPGADKAAMRSTVGRPGEPQEIVGPALLLASKAGGYMNNALLVVDGGRLMGAGIHDGLKLPEETYI